MRCPVCKNLNTKVVDSRPTDDTTSIRRRRECFKCGHRFTTYERLGEKPLIVIKRDGASEAFDGEKIFRGILTACAKRPVDPDDVSNLIKDIENNLRAKGITEIKSDDLGEMILSRIAKIDQVAYVRFASVYKEFNNVNEFKTLLKKLK